MNRALRITSAIILLLANLVPAVGAQVKPGDVITPKNAARVAELLSPGNYALVRQGMRMNIVQSEDYYWPPPYQVATEKYSPQVRLGKHGNLKNYLAGLPFPLLDTNDPNVARKIMWNFQFGPTYTDDLDAQDDSIVSIAPGGKEPFEDFPVGHLAVYRNVGRTEVAPTPTDYDGDTGIMERMALAPIVTPIADPFWDAPSTSFVWYRYSSPKRSDLIWSSMGPGGWGGSYMGSPMYLMGNSFFGNLDLQSLFGFTGKLTDWDFKFLGVRQMLACVHAKNLPAKACKADGGRTICPENWELRRVYIVEADARGQGFLGDRPAITKRILYIDSEGWFITASDLFDRGGKLWKTIAIFNTVRDREYPDSKAAVYTFYRLFQTALVDEDLQSGYSTIFYTPDPEQPPHDTWFINQGVISQRWIIPQRFTDFRQYFY
ncbi:MAG TPA: DUF1329 domain-containing protein [Candidatus Binataceae bacterium]|nr:DUF1329 domain-containing protein [Candidatus Binataceae bacterium]